MSRIGFIGNFTGAPYTTENDRKWSLEKLGHEVIPFQENRTTWSQIWQASNKLDALLYSHTHGWEIEGLAEVFAKYKEIGIPTASAHLDRWAGLARESDVGNEATWFTEYMFMADASPEAVKLYEKQGVKWHWLKPGVVERDCYMAEPDRKRYPFDVVFIGSKGYHEEYPQRPQIISWLEEVYGERFGHYGNDGRGVIRGADLNTLLASAKVVVGDSCFAGMTSNYWSDRIPEVTGRGGFLIHPEVDGLDHKGVPTWRSGDYLHLRELIDYFVSQDDAREEVRRIGHEWTKQNRTYTQLTKEMLEVMGIE